MICDVGISHLDHRRWYVIYALCCYSHCTIYANRLGCFWWYQCATKSPFTNGKRVAMGSLFQLVAITLPKFAIYSSELIAEPYCLGTEFNPAISGNQTCGSAMASMLSCRPGPPVFFPHRDGDFFLMVWTIRATTPKIGTRKFSMT